MASIIKRQGKTRTTYQVRWRQDGQQQAQSFTSHREAREFAAHIESGVAKGTAAPPEARDTTLAQWHTYWQQTRAVRPSTAATGATLMAKHVLPVLGQTRLDKLTQIQVQALVSGIDAAPTARRVYQELRTCLAAAVTAGYLHQTPCRGIALPKAERKTMNVLTPEEIKELAESMPDRYQTLIYVLAYGGLRIGEAIALKPTDITATGLDVKATLTRDAKGREIIGVPKTTAGVRHVPLPPKVLDMVRDHIKTYPAEYVFTGKTGERLNYRNFNRRVFKAKTNIDIHDLRHTAVTLWIANGVDLPRLAAWAGHTNPSFTLAQYAGYFPKDDDKFMAKMDQTLV